MTDKPVAETVCEMPTTPDELHEFIRQRLGVHVPRRAVCSRHDSPWDYVCRSFFDGRDRVVWSCRGGGKSFAAALVTLLTALFKPGIEQVILGGSQQQSDRVAEHVRRLLSRLDDQVDRASRRRAIRLVNGSVIHVLAQSQTAIRGIHVDRVRCDELDLFDPEVWRALWFTTTGQKTGCGSLEALSTAHRPGGLMEDLIARCRGITAVSGSTGETPVIRTGGTPVIRTGGTPVVRPELIKWCLWDVIERCGPQRRCEDCPLAPDCRGKARQAEGFFLIDDAIAIQARSSRSAWECEMLCRGARREWLVYGDFDPEKHVAPVRHAPELRLYRGIDPGFVSPFVCLWIQVTADGCVHVLEEYVSRGQPLEAHAKEINRRTAGRPVEATYIDPAASARGGMGQSCADLLGSRGILCGASGSRVIDGIELIRSHLAPAVGPPRLKINPDCRELIRSFQSYHYAGPEGGGENPVKDGPDHALDALRYFFVNEMLPGAKLGSRAY